MKTTAFHCEHCGVRLVVSVEEPTATCEECGEVVDVPGFVDSSSASSSSKGGGNSRSSRGTGRRGATTGAVGAAFAAGDAARALDPGSGSGSARGGASGKASARERPDSRRHDMRRGSAGRRVPSRRVDSRGASGPSAAGGGVSPMAIAIGLVLVGGVVLGLLALGGGGDRQPPAAALTRSAVEGYLGGLTEQTRSYLDSLADTERRRVAGQVREMAERHFAAAIGEGGADPVAARALLDGCLAAWVAARDAELGMGPGGTTSGGTSGDSGDSELASATGGAQGGDTSSGASSGESSGESSGASGGDSAGTPPDSTPGSGGDSGPAAGDRDPPSVAALRMYLDTQPAKRAYLTALRQVLCDEGRGEARERVRSAELQLKRAASARYAEVPRDPLLERVEQVLAGYAQQLKSELDAQRPEQQPPEQPEPPGPTPAGEWVVPRLVQQRPEGTWRQVGAAADGAFVGVAKTEYGMGVFGPTDYARMEMSCELRIAGGSAGIWFHGLAKHGQFSGFFERAGIKPAADQWYAIRAVCLADRIEVTITPPEGLGAGKRLTQKVAGKPPHYAFGFVAHPGATLSLRKLRVRKLK